jgi:hypothetical protein
MCRHISWTLDSVVKNTHWVTRIPSIAIRS